MLIINNFERKYSDQAKKNKHIMKLVIDHKKFGCKTIFSDWVQVDDPINKPVYDAEPLEIVCFKQIESIERINHAVNGDNQYKTTACTDHNGRSAEIPAEIPAEVPAVIPAEVHTEISAEIPAEIPAEISAEISVEIPAELTSEISTQLTFEIPTELPAEKISTETSTKKPVGPELLDKRDDNTCDICNRVFNSKSNLKIHKSSHDKKKTFICDICRKSFYTYYHLKNHMRKHDGCTPFKCGYCRKHFTTATGLSIHMKKHTGKMLQRCNICEQVFSAPYHLKKHMIKHTKEKLFECNICQKRFSRQGSLHVHQRLHSAESPRYKCEMCPKRFHWQSNLKAHQPTHYDGCTRCDICKRKFESSFELEMHTAFHAPDVHFQCVWCGKSYSSRHKLHYHIKNSHVKMPSFQCDQCDKTFKFSQQLKIHRIVHTDDKPRCYVCNKTFLTKYNLQSHLTSHVSSKSFECDICSIKFTYKRNLYIHLKRHVMVREQKSDDGNGNTVLRERRKKMKKLKCTTCNREFAYEKSLKKCDHKRLMVGKVGKKSTMGRKSKEKQIITLVDDNSKSNMSIQTESYDSMYDMPNQNYHADNNFKVQVNIVLGDAEQPCVPLWELNIPTMSEHNHDLDYVPSSPPIIEPKEYVYGINDEIGYFYYPTYLNSSCITPSEPIDFSMGFSPVSQIKYSPFNVNNSEEQPIDYSFHNVRLINNFTYREL